MIRNMEIKTSTIPNAGNGVFTRVSIPKGTFIGYYRGKIIDVNTAKNTDYVLTLNDGTSICGKDKSHFGPMINCHTATPYPANVTYTEDGKLQTVRAIRAGEELFADYGRNYWIGRPELLYDTALTNIRKTRRARRPKKE